MLHLKKSMLYVFSTLAPLSGTMAMVKDTKDSKPLNATISLDLIRTETPVFYSYLDDKYKKQTTISIKKLNSQHGKIADKLMGIMAYSKETRIFSDEQKKEIIPNILSETFLKKDTLTSQLIKLCLLDSSHPLLEKEEYTCETINKLNTLTNPIKTPLLSLRNIHTLAAFKEASKELKKAVESSPVTFLNPIYNRSDLAGVFSKRFSFADKEIISEEEKNLLVTTFQEDRFDKNWRFDFDTWKEQGFEKKQKDLFDELKSKLKELRPLK